MIYPIKKPLRHTEATLLVGIHPQAKNRKSAKLFTSRAIYIETLIVS